MTTLALTLPLLAVSVDATAVDAPLVEKISEKRAQTNRARANRCLRPLWRSWVPAYKVPVQMRPYTLEVEKRRLANALAASSRCLPTDPVSIIRYVFPDATENAAISVARCETGGTFDPYARNPSGASGLFQLMPFHWQGKFNPFDPWANSRYALRLSDGGWNWGPWVCKP